jgi:hypothetical protein
LVQIAEQLLAEVNFTGGPTDQFEPVGRETFVALLECGLLPHHNFLDFGCGALRLGYWLIRFMDEGRYFGIEPNTKWLDAGKRITIGQELRNQKKPRFNNNADPVPAIRAELLPERFFPGVLLGTGHPQRQEDPRWRVARQ